MQIRGKYKEMGDLKKEEETRQQRIIKAKEDLAIAEAELRNLPVYEPPKDVLVSILFSWNWHLLLVVLSVPGQYGNLTLAFFYSNIWKL